MTTVNDGGALGVAARRGAKRARAGAARPPAIDSDGPGLALGACDELRAASEARGRQPCSSEERRPARIRAKLPPTSEELLARYRRRPNARLRNELIERHRDDVEAIARALAMRLPRSVDVHDLVHAGLWGLVQAIDKFQAERGAPFRPFMRPRVRGAMLDELRNMDFLPRLYRQRARELEAATLRLRARLGREPSDAELASELGITEVRLRAGYARLQDLPTRDLLADPAGDAGDPFDRLADEAVESPIDALNRQDLLERIEATLQPIEWMVLKLHYLEGLSGKEVAVRLRLSAARICQIHVRVLSRLKLRFASSAP